MVLLMVLLHLDVLLLLLLLRMLLHVLRLGLVTIAAILRHL